MSTLQNLRFYLYSITLFIIPVVLFFLMTEGLRIEEAQGQNAIAPTTTLDHNLSGIHEDDDPTTDRLSSDDQLSTTFTDTPTDADKELCSEDGGEWVPASGSTIAHCLKSTSSDELEAKRECEFKGGRWEQLNNTDTYYCRVTETEAEKEVRINATDEHIEVQRSEASVFHESVAPVLTCKATDNASYNCGKQQIFFFKLDTQDGKALQFSPEEAARIYNELIYGIDTCEKDSSPVYHHGCNLKVATGYDCSSLPGLQLSTFRQDSGLLLYVSDEILYAQSVDPAIENEKPIDLKLTNGDTLPPLPPIIKDDPENNENDLPSIRLNPYIVRDHILPEECKKVGVTTERQCEIFQQQKDIPQLCKDNHINTVEGCKRFILDKEIESARMAGIPTEVTHGLPKKCEILNITDVVKCNQVVAESAIPHECREAGIASREECNEKLEESYKEQAGATCEEGVSPEDCINRTREEFSEKTVCVGLPKDECREALQEQHFGTYLAKREEFDKNELVAIRLAGKSVLSIDRLEDDEKEIIEQTITNDRAVYVYPAIGNVVLTESNELDVAPSALIILDDDGDGLSNELEGRIGTDPNRKDTDDDGFDDREELQNGFDPLGDGEREFGFWPIDGAMIYELPLDQPKISEAGLDEALIVDPIENITTDKATPLHTLSGTGPANTLLTVYVYSTLPMVLTVQTDKDGNWEYTLEESLADGEHEVFITLVDTFGSITKKSNSFTFFVQEAQAVEADEFFGFETITVSSDIEPVNQFSRYYLYGAVSLVLFALVIAVFFIWNSRAREEMFPEVTDDDIPHV